MKAYTKKLRNSINQLKWRAKIFKMIDYEFMKERLAIKGIHGVDCPYNSPSKMLPVPQVGEVRHFTNCPRFLRFCLQWKQAKICRLPKFTD